MKFICLVIGTKNKGKVREIKSIYRQWFGKPAGNPALMRGRRQFRIKFIPLNSFPDAPDIRETGRTYLDNAIKKAVSWAKYLNHIVLAEDSGIEIKALNWKPGIHSARFASKDKHRNAADAENHIKLLALLKGLPRSRRAARYRCAAVVAHPVKGVILKSQGTCRGYIASHPKGKNGFGYDPVFQPVTRSLSKASYCEVIPQGANRGQPAEKAFSLKTFGQLPAYIKNRLSHRGKAIRGIISLLTPLSGRHCGAPGLSADLQQIHKILDTNSKSH